MYSPLQLALRYGKYRLSAYNGRGHGMHSPFVYALIRDVLNDREKYPAYTRVEQLRKQLLQNQEMLPVTDFGAGSVTGTHPQRSIASIARHAAKPRKYGQLLYRLVQYFTPAQLLELGTSLGITSSYLALGYDEGRLHTIEGAPAIAAMAQRNFDQLGLTNIKLYTGQFEQILPPLLQQTCNGSILLFWMATTAKSLRSITLRVYYLLYITIPWWCWMIFTGAPVWNGPGII